MPRKHRAKGAADPFAWFRRPTQKKGEAEPVETHTVESTPPTTEPPRILTALRGVLRRKHYSPETERAYVSWVRRFVRHHDLRHPRDMGETEITEFLEYLAVQRRVGASTQNQALAALIFFYRHVLGRKLDGIRKSAAAKQRRPLPVVVSPQEAQQIIARIDGPAQLVVAILYGSGLRLKEALRLRLKDVDLEAPALFVRGGKGGKDRMALLPQVLVEAIRAQIALVCQQHARDVEEGAGWVEMPGALAQKFRGAGRELQWQWLFPATRCYHHRETGETRRHHLHPSVVQKKVKYATRKAGILKRVTCHTFRHSFATALLNMDYDIRTIQRLLGHRSIKTTMIYTHLQKDVVMRVQSPMDLLGAPPTGPAGLLPSSPPLMNVELLKARMAGFEGVQEVDSDENEQDAEAEWDEDEFDD